MFGLRGRKQLEFNVSVVLLVCANEARGRVGEDEPVVCVFGA